MRTTLKTLTLFVLLVLSSAQLIVPFNSFAEKGADAKNSVSGLTAAANKAAEAIKQSIGLRKIALDKSLIKDSTTGETSNLSFYLKNEFEAAFSKAGFTLVDSIQEADYFIAVSYQRGRSALRVFVKYRKSKGDMTYQSLDYSIKTYDLPEEAFSESLDSKVQKLVKRLSQNRVGLTIFMNPIVEGNYKYSCAFSNYLTLKVKTLLSANEHQVIDEKPIVDKLSNTRSIARRAATLENLVNSEAAFMDANAVLEGYYFEDKTALMVNLTLKDITGKVLASADERIDKTLITMSTENTAAKKLAEFADVVNERNDDMVKISAGKGGKHQVYYSGEKIKFNIMVKKPLYLHIYNIDSDGNVNILYPKAGEGGAQFQPKMLYTIPQETADWELVVEPPFGTDTVKLFAFDKDMPLPIISRDIPSRSFTSGTRAVVGRDKIQQKLADQPSINQNDLVDYYRGAAAKRRWTLYEDSLYIQTKNK